MQINLESIPLEGIKIDTRESTDVLSIKEKNVKFGQDLLVSITVHLTNDTLLVKGTLEANIEVNCARCLKKLGLKIINDNFSFDKDVKGEKVVDIIDEIREGIILLLPVKILCNSNCKGLCPSCGEDLNQKECSCDKKNKDIRWSDLNKLKLE